MIPPQDANFDPNNCCTDLQTLKTATGVPDIENTKMVQVKN